MAKNKFIERSITRALSFFRESVLSDEYASKNGFLQRVDPRVKVLALTGLIAAVMFLRDIRPVLAVYPFCLALACLSRIPVFFFFKRTWVFVPLFSLFIALPALFSAFTPGEPLVSLPWGAITRQGLSSAALFVSRVLVSVSLAVLLTLTTRSAELFWALRRLGVPQIFVMTLSMSYRYIFLFTGIVQDMFLAVKSRNGGIIRCRRGQKIAAWNIASLWHKSLRMNEEVYRAMLSRGYTGEPKHCA